MKTAIHHTSRTSLTVEQYVTTYGPKLDAKGNERPRPYFICVACNARMHTVAENGPLRDATWAHNPDPSSPWCPLKDEAAKPYLLLSPTNPNPALGVALRASFFKNWQFHWTHAVGIVAMSDIHSFIGFINHADAKGIWQQVGLEEWFLPYIFLSTCDSPPPKSKKGAAVRSNWIRCRFDVRVRTHEDLWIRTQGDWGFFRAEYRTPKTGEPNKSHFINATSVKPDPLFLGKGISRANLYQIGEMKKAFPTEVI